MQNYTAVRGLLAKSEPMGIWQEENGRNVEWKGCGKLIIYLISRATFCLFICCDYRAATFTLLKSDWQEEGFLLNVSHNSGFDEQVKLLLEVSLNVKSD